MMSTATRSGYRGYVTSREFGGARIPVPVQSLVLRDYCSRKGLMYKLHLNENMFPHSYLVLEGLVRNLSAFEGILMCSMYMLPQRAERRRKIYRRIFEQAAELHLVLEDIILRNIADTEAIEEVLSAANLLPLCPTRIPEDLIGSDW
ncbi:MAG: LIC12192 family sporadic carbohydrate cluster protein [Betaproteobacteria bacterium]